MISLSYKKKKIVLAVMLFLLLPFCSEQNVYAAEIDKNEALREAVSNQSSNNYTEEFKKNTPKRIRQHIYETATINSLAYLQLGLSSLDLNEDDNVDYFLKITECDLYTRYKSDEFEWVKIREATRGFVKENKKDYPMRFELIIPLKLEEYNAEKSYFDIQKASQIKSVRLFEIKAQDIYAERLCGDSGLTTGNFKKAILLELSRPFSMTTVPVDNLTAEKIIKEKSSAYQEILKKQTVAKFVQKDLYDMREVYLVIYAKIFTYKGDYTISDERLNTLTLAQVLAVVDGYEIFEDIGRKKLLYSRNYITKKNFVKARENLEKEIEIIKQRINKKGILS